MGRWLDVLLWHSAEGHIMNAYTSGRDWTADVREMPITSVADALSLQHTGRGEHAKYVLPHADCHGRALPRCPPMSPRPATLEAQKS